MADPIPAGEFSRNFDRYQHQAVSAGVIRVSSHGRIVGGFLSPEELEHYERLKRREQQVLVVGALLDDVVTDIEATIYDVAAKPIRPQTSTQIGRINCAEEEE
jgi:hypothetical protein